MKIRLLVHVVTAVLTMYFLGALPGMQLGERVIDLGPVGAVLGVLAIIWTLNLFNFMDGIDGIAASEGVFVAAGGASLMFFSGSQSLAPVALLLAASCLGFLIWNWPPAKIFMGDVGSGYIGYMIAVLAIVEARDNPSAFFVWLILGGFFFVDATLTLVRRLIRREKIYHPHRTHAYQWLSRRWSSHRRVTLFVLAIDAVWLLPLASLCVLVPSYALWMVVIALFPITVLVLIAGAGRPE